MGVGSIGLLAWHALPARLVMQAWGHAACQAMPCQ